jgi:hypothetical protein
MHNPYVRVARPVDLFASAAAAVVILGVAGVPGSALAEQKSGSAGILTNRPCPPDATSCTGARNYTQHGGGMSAGFSMSASDIPGGANAAASVAFGDGYLPTIKARSQAGSETRTGASVVAFRSFTYEGDAAIDLALNGALHYVSSGDFLAGEAPGEGQLYVALSLLSVSALSGYGPDTDAVTLISNNAVNFADCSSGAIAQSDYSGFGTSGEHTVNLSLATACDGGAITINPGDQFVLVATLQSISNRGGFIDAMNTFVVQYDEENTVFTDTGEKVGLPGLQATVNGGIPEPGTWALMILGFGGVGAALRRRTAWA